MRCAPLAVVLHGASADRPDEADTILQAELVQQCLRRLRWDAAIKVLGPHVAELDRLLTPRPAFVFNLVEAIGGDGRRAHLVPDALGGMGVAFTGSAARAQFRTTYKPLAKRLMRAAGLPTPDWFGPSGRVGAQAERHDRYIVKSTAEDASIGIDAASVVAADMAMAEMAARRARFGGRWFAEAYIEGREFNVGLLQGSNALETLPIAEIAFVDFPEDRPKIVDYEAKWEPDSFGFRHTPRRFVRTSVDAALLDLLRDLSCRAFRLFGLSGYGRVDFRVDADGRPWVLEVNANPCLAEDAGFMAAAVEAGLRLEDVVDRIVRAAGVEPIGMVA